MVIKIEDLTIKFLREEDEKLTGLLENSDDIMNMSEVSYYPPKMPTEMKFKIEKDGKVIGSIVFSRIRWFNRKSEISIILKKEFQGKGYGKKSLKAAMDFAFNKMNLHRLEAEVYEFNNVSIKLIESLGFKKEGILREAQYSKGKYWDIIRYGILRNEFE